MLVEICANSYRSALAALNGGAQRVELCSVLGIGGVTPSYGAISMTAELNISCNVLIRPRQGDFIYSGDEVEEICRDIDICAGLGANGVVMGALTKQGRVDRSISNLLLDRAKRHNLSVTFHRAIDRSKEILEDLEVIIEMGYDRVLTSGGKATAFEGRETIREMVKLSGGRIVIMPGSGITPLNVRELVDFTGVKEVHLSATKLYKSESEALKETISFTPTAMGGDYSLLYSDESTIREVVRALDSIA